MSTDLAISKGFQRAANLAFMQSVEQYTNTALYTPFCKRFDSTRTQENHQFTLGMLEVREWLGERVYNKLRMAGFALTNRDWELSLQWQFKNVRDNPELVKDKVPEMAASAADHPTALFMEQVIAGETIICYDDKAFFAVDHPSYREGDTFSNLFTGTGTTADQIRADFHSVVRNILKLKKTNGQPLFMRKLTFQILHPVELREKFSEIFEEEDLKASSANNPDYKKALIHDAPWLDSNDVNDWYIGITSEPQKPFIHQVNSEFKMRFVQDEWETNTVKWQGKAEYEVGPAHPCLMYKVKNT